MIQHIISVTVFLLVFLAFRWIVAGKVSRCLSYGLWLLVAVRMFVPGGFFVDMPLREITDFLEQPVWGTTRQADIDEAIEEAMKEGMHPFIPDVQAYMDANSHLSVSERLKYVRGAYPVYLESEYGYLLETGREYNGLAPSWGELVFYIWLCGAVFTGVWFAITNIMRKRRICKACVEAEGDGSPIPVRVSAQTYSPCLIGLIHPVMILTPQCIADAELEAHIRAHEMTHYEHRDHMWSFLRSLCLCLYWFHPLIWLAAALCRRDCELACDEGAIKRLGENERIPYGRTLVAIIERTSMFSSLMYVGTPMADGSRYLRWRVGALVNPIKANQVVSGLVILATFAIMILAYGLRYQWTNEALLKPEVYWKVKLCYMEGIPQEKRKEDALAFIVQGENSRKVVWACDQQTARAMEEQEFFCLCLDKTNAVLAVMNIEDFGYRISPTYLYVKQGTTTERLVCENAEGTQVWEYPIEKNTVVNVAQPYLFGVSNEMPQFLRNSNVTYAELRPGDRICIIWDQEGKLSHIYADMPKEWYSAWGVPYE